MPHGEPRDEGARVAAAAEFAVWLATARRERESDAAARRLERALVRLTALKQVRSAIRAGASWGFFDFRMKGENFPDGYQSVPVDWGIHSPRKRAFFAKLQEITGGLK